MEAHIYNPSCLEAEAGEQKFKDSLDNLTRPYVKNKELRKWLSGRVLACHVQDPGLKHQYHLETKQTKYLGKWSK